MKCVATTLFFENNCPKLFRIKETFFLKKIEFSMVEIIWFLFVCKTYETKISMQTLCFPDVLKYFIAKRDA